MDRKDSFYSCLETPFSTYGLMRDEAGFYRLPREVAEATSERVTLLYRNTAGGRVRFRTDSPFVAIRAKLDGIARMSHFALTGIAGLDLYYKEDGKFLYGGTFIPPYDFKDGFESRLPLPQGDGGEQEILIHFPLYSNVRELEICVEEGASLSAAPAYRNAKPVVFYGSSITQGGCASRPGSAYTNILSRRLNMNYVNLGFSGGAHAEDAIIEYIAGLSMSVFVLDYDHNALTAEYLRQTHEKMFRRIRSAQPELPVIMISRPKVYLTPEEKERREIVKETWLHAKAQGDERVYWIDGSRLLMRFGEGEGTVDNIHPTDLGFWCMAEGIAPVLEQVLSGLEGSGV